MDNRVCPGHHNVLDERMRNAKAFVFDFYGTVAGDAVSVPPMWQVLADLGYPSHPELEAMFEPDSFDGTTTISVDGGRGHDGWIEGNWRQFVRLSGVPVERVEEVLRHLLAVRAAYRAKEVPETSSLISLLRSHGLRVGLCSNWENDIDGYLEQAELPSFDAVVTSCQIGARKPNRLIFQAICERLGVAPDDTVFIGDNWQADIVGALRHGMTPVWIRCGRPSRGLTRHVAEFDSLARLFSHMTQLLTNVYS